MTLQITNVKSAQYDSDGVAIFQVDCGDIATDTKIFNSGERDAANDAILQAWLDDGNVVSEYVAPVIQQDATPSDLRRNDRRQEFAETLNAMNNLWYDSLSQSDKDALSTWRTAWLDYPDDLNASRPVRLSMFPKDLS
tara:strand:- start:109 stop:522 length:414 start_codon:yes stop_codon:yes gene_type:complete